MLWLAKRQPIDHKYSIPLLSSLVIFKSPSALATTNRRAMALTNQGVGVNSLDQSNVGFSNRHRNSFQSYWPLFNLHWPVVISISLHRLDFPKAGFGFAKSSLLHVVLYHFQKKTYIIIFIMFSLGFFKAMVFSNAVYTVSWISHLFECNDMRSGKYPGVEDSAPYFIYYKYNISPIHSH